MKTIPFSFVHCADLHLDSPFEGVHAVAPNIAEVLRNATFQAFGNVIDLAIQEHVDFLIIAGDVYDGADRSLRAQWRFYQALGRAADSGIQCFVTHGNHDPLSGWEAEISVPERVHRFGGDVDRIVAKRGDEELAYVYGISYPSRDINENLARRFSPEGSAPFAIGVLHCNVGGTPDHDNYAPCTIDDLVACGIDYWALGHIHAGRILREREPCIIYPGSTQGRSVRELGERGCYLVKVDETGHIKTQFVPTDVVRWFIEDVDISDLATLGDLVTALTYMRDEVRHRADGRSAVLRFRLTGRGEVHRDLRNQESEIVSVLREGELEKSEPVWVESIENHTRPAVDLPQRRQVEDFVGEFLRAAEELRSKPDTVSIIRRLLKGPTEHSIIADQLDSLEDDQLLSILDDAETLGLDLLLEGKG